LLLLVDSASDSGGAARLTPIPDAITIATHTTLIILMITHCFFFKVICIQFV
jgi:hypothetical protein